MNLMKMKSLKVLLFTAIILLAAACETYPDVRSQKVAVLLAMNPDIKVVCHDHRQEPE